MQPFNFHYYNGSIDIRLSGERITGNIQRAQMYLDEAIVRDCNQYVPFRSGRLRDSGTDHTIIGSGEVQWKTPYAHYQHTGKDMIGTVSKRHWVMKGEPKMYNGKALQYHTVGTGSFWFEKAKRVHGKQWVKNTKKIAGGG